MRHCKKAMIVNTIIGLVMAAVFILIAASVLGDFFGQFPRVSGAVVDAEKVVCFGGGSDHHIHCLDKDSGEELFSVGSGTKWDKSKSDAKSTPTLTKTAIYFGLGQYFCGFTVAGSPKFECQKFSNTIVTGVAANEDVGLACFGDGANPIVYCRGTSDGLAKFSVRGTSDFCPQASANLKVGGKTTVGGHTIALKEISNKDAKAVVVHIDDSSCGVRAEQDCSGIKIKVIGATDSSAHLLFPDYKECKAMSTPAITQDAVYLAVGNRICKYRTSFLGEGTPATDTSEEWCKGGGTEIQWDIPTGVAANEEKDLVCFGGGDDHTVHCYQTNGNWKFSVHGRWGNCPNAYDFKSRDCLARSTPTITDSAVYFGLGNRVCKYKTDGAELYEADENSFYKFWCSGAFPKTIETGIAVNEELGYACFGDGAAHTVYCLSTADGKEIFEVRAGNWDARSAMSTPAIKNGALYLGLGDHACAFKLPLTSDSNKDFESKKYSPNVDPDILWQDADDRGCADVDWTIPTGIAVFDEPAELQAAEQQGAGQQKETCAEGSVDLMLSEPIVADLSGASLDKANFPAGQPFTVSTTLQATNNNCASFATMGLYGAAPGQQEQLFGGGTWSAVEPGQTISYGADSLPATGAGDYTITFRIVSTTPQVQPPNGDTAQIILTVQ